MAFFNPFRPSYIEDPYPSLARLRREDPVHWSPELDGWVLTRHEDCVRVLRDQETFSNDGAVARGGVGRHVAESRARSPLGGTPLLGSSDPPVHTRLRGIVNRAFTPRVVEAERPVVREVVTRLLDETKAGEPFDLMPRLAEPLPVIVIGDLLGFDEEDRGPVWRWANRVMRVVGGGDLPPDAYRDAEEAHRELFGFLERYTERHREDETRKVISMLVEAEREGDRLSIDELVAFLVFLYTAGAGPTSFMIGNAVLALLRHPDALERVRADRSLVRRALEESLRWDSATHTLLRFACEETTIGRRVIQPGDAVFAIVGAAHRDPDVFPNPDRFDIDRELSANDILAFGIGPHFCLGQPLAYIEAEEALNQLLDRFEALTLPRDGLRRGDTFLLRGPGRLVLEGR